jgi:TP901 family phage tail tape measure protein
LELATALRYTATSGQQAGVTFEKLVSYIATVSSTTRGSAETIGQSFKTMFARMQDIRAGNKDEDGMGINNVEKALHAVNIKLRDSQGQFRDLSTVLEEVANKWDNLTQIEQNSLAKAIAGKTYARTYSDVWEFRY